MDPDAVRALAATTRAFLFAAGEAALSAAEKESLATLEKAVGEQLCNPPRGGYCRGAVFVMVAAALSWPSSSCRAAS